MEPTPIQLPEIDTNPDHNLNNENDYLNPDEITEQNLRLAFQQGLNKLSDNNNRGIYQGRELKHFQETLRICCDLFALIKTNQEGVVPICKRSYWESADPVAIRLVGYFLEDRYYNVLNHVAKSYTKDQFTVGFDFNPDHEDISLTYQKEN